MDQYEPVEVDAKVKELRLEAKKMKKMEASRVMSERSKNTTNADLQTSPGGSPKKINEDSSGDEKDPEEEKKLMNMTVGQRRTYEAKMKKMKEFAVIFEGIFKLMVKDQMVSSNNDLKVLEFGKEYPEQLQTLNVLKSAAKYQ